MARKKISDLKSFKFSFDLNGENKEVLDDLTSNYNLKYGPMLNMIISTFCSMPENMKAVFERTCKSEYQRLADNINNVADGFHKQSLEDELNSYKNILRLINHGNYEINNNEDDPLMQKVRLCDGYLLIPRNWILLNRKEAEKSKYAYVVECRNSETYEIPHFVYFSNVSDFKSYSDPISQDIFKYCRNAWERFEEIEDLARKNELVPDPENEGHYLNVDEHLKSPQIGIFKIADQGDRPFKNPPPYGAMIVRTKE